MIDMIPNYYMMWHDLREEINRLEAEGIEGNNLDLGDLQRIMDELELDHRD